MTIVRAIVAFLGGWRATGFAIAALILGLGLWAQTERLKSARYAWAQTEAARALAVAAAEHAAREEEQVRQKALGVVDRAYQRGLEDGKAAADKLLADRDAGAIRLRDKFRCPARVPGEPGAAGGGDGGEGAILSRADQDFLVRLAEEADRNTRQLAACQAVVRALTDGQHAGRTGN